MSETDFAHFADSHKRRYVKFDPTINTGTIVTLLTVLLTLGGAWSSVQSRLDRTDDKNEQLKAQATADRNSTEKALTEIKSDVKEMSRTLNQATQTLAVIEARQQPKGKQ